VIAVIAALAAVPAVARVARADASLRVPLGTFLLQLGDAKVGSVRLLEGTREGSLVVSSGDVSPAVVSIVEAFVAGKTLKKDLKLSAGAVMRKAEGARLSVVKLPAMGSGGAAEIELDFVAPTVTTQPLLSLKTVAATSTPGARISSFRVDLSSASVSSSVPAAKLDAITLTQRPDGVVAPSPELTLEIPTGGAGPVTAWSKVHAAKASPRALGVEYVGADGAAILKVRLEGCVPTSVVPMGASAATRVVVRCVSAKPG